MFLRTAFRLLSPVDLVLGFNHDGLNISYHTMQNKQATLEFSCGHTEGTRQGFTLTLTIFGHAQSKDRKSFSKLSLSDIAALWTVHVFLSYSYSCALVYNKLR